MLLTPAREIAQAELQRVRAQGGPDLEITSTLSAPRGWVFVASRRGSEGDHGAEKFGVAVREDGRVFHGLDREHASYTSSDLEWLIPNNKGDFDRARAAAALGYPAVEPALPDLLKCLQDMNWPIAFVMGRFLASIGAPLAPHLRTILAGDDDVWKYWIVGGVIGSNAELFALFKDDLTRLANNPTAGEHTEEVDERAREVLQDGPSSWPVRNPRSPTGEW